MSAIRQSIHTRDFQSLGDELIGDREVFGTERHTEVLSHSLSWEVFKSELAISFAEDVENLWKRWPLGLIISSNSLSFNNQEG